MTGSQKKFWTGFVYNWIHLSQFCPLERPSWKLNFSCSLSLPVHIFLSHLDILESICYCVILKWLINESNTTKGLRKIWTVALDFSWWYLTDGTIHDSMAQHFSFSFKEQKYSELGRNCLSTWECQFSYNHCSQATLISVSASMGDCSSAAWVWLLTLKVG